jgi:hypothetical protein
MLGDFDPADHGHEAKQRWGDTAAYRAAARRTARYTPQDWEEIGRESAEIDAAFVALMDSGAAADGATAMDLAERHRAHISKWFYDCSPEIHGALGRMYVADPRFTDRIDATAPGLAAFVSKAIVANAGR